MSYSACQHHEDVHGYDICIQPGQGSVPVHKNDEGSQAGKIANPKTTIDCNNAQIIDSVNVGLNVVGSVTGNTKKRGSGVNKHDGAVIQHPQY